MSRNLCSSYCRTCGYQVKISDLRGKPVEFRQYGRYVPVLGVRFDCSCGQVYFASWRTKHEYWSRETLDSGAWKDRVIRFEVAKVLEGSSGSPVFKRESFEIPNAHPGKYAIESTRHDGRIEAENTGVFSIDLSYYETYNDEPLWDEAEKASIRNREREPWHLLKGDAEETQLVLGEPPTLDGDD